MILHLLKNRSTAKKRPIHGGVKGSRELLRGCGLQISWMCVPGGGPVRSGVAGAACGATDSSTVSLFVRSAIPVSSLLMVKYVRPAGPLLIFHRLGGHSAYVLCLRERAPLTLPGNCFDLLVVHSPPYKVNSKKESSCRLTTLLRPGAASCLTTSSPICCKY